MDFEPIMRLKSPCFIHRGRYRCRKPPTNFSDEAKEEENQAVNALSIIKEKIRDYWLDKHRKDHGVYVGAIVLLNDGRKAAVDSVRAKESRGGKPWITGRVEKKNGGYGKATRNLYSHWTILNT